MEVLGINDKAELAAAEAILQEKLRAAAMAAGVTMTDPSSVWLSVDTVLGSDVTLEPGVFVGPGVEIAEGATVKAFSYMEGATVGAGCSVGPFARLRPGAVLEAGAKVGNFVEVKNARIKAGAKANHLTYIGDAIVGEKANIGAGTIVCNYDGFAKHKSEIGAGAFIGSNTALVAPVKIGDGAVVGAGSTITKDVAANDLALSRGAEKFVSGGAERFRARRKPPKQAG